MNIDCLQTIFHRKNETQLKHSSTYFSAFIIKS